MALATQTIIGLSLLVGIVVDLILFYVASLLGRKISGKTGLVPLISEEDKFPSLARFQLLVWTFVIVFAFVTVSFIRIFSGVLVSVAFPTNLLTLLGVSVGSPVISAGVSQGKYSSGGKKLEDKEDYQPLYTMIEENTVFSTTRFQMLAWTFVSVIIFLATLFALLSNLPSNLSQLGLPNVSSTLIALSGISQGAYLLGKGVSASDKATPK